MWHDVENGTLALPATIDAMSSRNYVFIRKDFEIVDEVIEDGKVVSPAHYKWKEMKVPREMWKVVEAVFNHEGALDDVYAALTELAEMIVG